MINVVRKAAAALIKRRESARNSVNGALLIFDIGNGSERGFMYT